MKNILRLGAKKYSTNSPVKSPGVRDAAVRQTKNVTDWSAPPPPPAGQLAVTAAPSRRGWTWLAAAWPCALRTASAATRRRRDKESHGRLYLSVHVLDPKTHEYLRIDVSKRCPTVVSRRRRAAPKGPVRPYRTNCNSPPEKDWWNCWNVAIL